MATRGTAGVYRGLHALLVSSETCTEMPAEDYVVNENVTFEEIDNTVTVSLYHYGHALTASTELQFILGALRDGVSTKALQLLHREAIQKLADSYVLLRPSEAQALRAGLAVPASFAVGPSFAPWKLHQLPSHAVCVFGAPLDTTCIPPFSAAHGPQCIRRHFVQEDTAEASRVSLSDLGNIIRWPDDGLATIGTRIHHMVDRIGHADCLPVMLGGDHATSFYALRAVAGRGQPFAILHLDAHADLGTLTSGNRASPLNHANVMGYALNLPNLVALVQVGVRTQTGFAPNGVNATTITTSAFRRQDVQSIVDRLPTCPLYVSIDLDVVDPSLAPEVTTPVLDGLTLSEVESLVRSTVARRRLLGADLVEVCEGVHADNRAARCAATLLATIAQSWEEARRDITISPESC